MNMTYDIHSIARPIYLLVSACCSCTPSSAAVTVVVALLSHILLLYIAIFLRGEKTIPFQSIKHFTHVYWNRKILYSNVEMIYEWMIDYGYCRRWIEECTLSLFSFGRINMWWNLFFKCHLSTVYIFIFMTCFYRKCQNI